MEFERIWHSPVNRLRAEMGRLVEDVFRDGGGRAWITTRNALPLNVWQDDTAIYVEAELPGVDRKDVELSVHEDELTLRGRRPEPKNAGETLQCERPSGEFERTLALPFDVDASKAEATFENGVLRIVLPKAPHARARRIEIQAK